MLVNNYLMEIESSNDIQIKPVKISGYSCNKFFRSCATNNIIFYSCEDLETYKEYFDMTKHIAIAGFDGKSQISLLYYCTDEIYNEYLIENLYGVRDFYTECHIMGLCVNKDYRKVGIGKKMINYLMSKYKKITLDVGISNKKVIEIFYKKLGFKIINKSDDNYLLMWKRKE